MAKIDNILDFDKVTSSITNFSHAYIFNVNSLELALPYAKEFSKKIIFDVEYSANEYDDICYQIDNDTFDDLYIVNPNTIGINNEEIDKLLSYMETKSIRKDGRRIYIICGVERLSQDVSNKILKFLEEPENNIYAILLSENIDHILPTIVSRCQMLNFIFPINEDDFELCDKMKKFLGDLILKKKTMIAYEYYYFDNSLKDRISLYNDFSVLERIISETINRMCKYKYDDKYVCEEMFSFSINAITNILNLTNKLKCLIKKNINLNLLIDRYIIEVTEELNICKK